MGRGIVIGRKAESRSDRRFVKERILASIANIKSKGLRALG